MKNNIKKHKTPFGYPFFVIVAFSIIIWLFWTTVTNVPERKRVPLNTTFFFSNIPFQENESYGSPLLFAKPSSKGFSADYNINLKDNSAIEFIPPQSPIFEELDSKPLAVSNPQVENIVKKTLAPELTSINDRSQPTQSLEKMISLSKNLKELNFIIDTRQLELKTDKSRYAFYMIQIDTDGTIQHIFVEKTNLTREQTVQLDKIIASATVDIPKTNVIGHIKFFLKQ